MPKGFLVTHPIHSKGAKLVGLAKKIFRQFVKMSSDSFEFWGMRCMLKQNLRIHIHFDTVHSKYHKIMQLSCLNGIRYMQVYPDYPTHLHSSCGLLELNGLILISLD